MTPESALDIFRQALLTALLIASPMLGVGLVVGLVISIFQAVTSIQEMTLTFIPKILAVVLSLFLFLPWMVNKLMDFSVGLFSSLATLR